MGLPNTRRGQRQSSTAATIPAAIMGINASQALASMAPDECIYSYNLLAQDLGMVVREGYVEWANGWTGGVAKTVITFEGNSTADDKLFIANDAGIWDVTTEGTTAPTQVVTFPSTAGNAGICSFVNFSNDGNARFLLVCDGENGYYRWTQSTNTWVKYTIGSGANQIAGVDPALFDFVMIWKERVWFIQKGSANAWYLDAGVFEGTAAKFNFGAQFRFGGALKSLHNWTLDGGSGIDDHLVAISSAGDVIVYQGTDPSDATKFGLIGSWQVGQLPAGNRIASEFSGELYILSIQGILPMSAVLTSANTTDADIYLTANISPYIRTVLTEEINSFGWHIHIHPKEGVLYVNSPPRESYEQLAFTLYFGNKAWSMVRGLDKAHTGNWQGDIFWTDITRNKMFIQRGTVDKVYLDPATDGQPSAITWNVLTSYQSMGLSPATYKRVQYIRPIFLSGGVPAFTVAARYDFDITEISGSPAYGIAGSGLWDTAIWNESVWGGGIETTDNPRGANGLGRHIAVALKGVSSEATTLAAFDIIFDEGGLM